MITSDEIHIARDSPGVAQQQAFTKHQSWKQTFIPTLSESAMASSVHIGRTLQFVRNHRGLSVARLARHLWISQADLLKIEEGVLSPSEGLEERILYWLHGEDGAQRIVRILINSVYYDGSLSPHQS